MAAVVAATALKGRGARNARVLRGKERDPGEGRIPGEPFFCTSRPATAGGQGCRFLLALLCRVLKSLGTIRWSLKVTQPIPLPSGYTTPLGSCCPRESQGSLLDFRAPGVSHSPQCRGKSPELLEAWVLAPEN